MYNEAAKRIYTRESQNCKSISVGQAHSFASTEQEIGKQLEQILGSSNAVFQIISCVAQRINTARPSGNMLDATVLVAGSFKALGREKAFSQTFVICSSGTGQDGELKWRIRNDMLVIM